jgi:bifunctional non-homologous end joining protein LigD
MGRDHRQAGLRSNAHGRYGDWLEMKCVADQELVIGGFTDPRGFRAGLGALLVGHFQGR